MGLLSRKLDARIAAYQQELIETHYREVDNMYRQIRGWRHDYRNHIQTMKAYAAAQDWEAIRRYLDLLDEDLTTVDTVIKTGNPMTDAILNSKISLAKAKGINVVADAQIPVRLKSSEIDLCCIIGNLFDNAIEASAKLPENRRMIRVYMDMKNTQLYISFTNFTAGKKLKKEGKLFRSTKGEGHGFGLVRPPCGGGAVRQPHHPPGVQIFGPGAGIYPPAGTRLNTRRRACLLAKKWKTPAAIRPRACCSMWFYRVGTAIMIVWLPPDKWNS